MSEFEGSGILEFIDFLKAKKQTGNGKIIIFAGAAISIKSPSGMPSADSLMGETLNTILENPGLHGLLIANNYQNRIRTAITEVFEKRLVPPELFYDSIYEHAGKKVFNAFASLRNGQPNVHHQLLVRLLEANYIDCIITTNFDSLLEQSIRSRAPWKFSAVRKRIWKIHGDINKPDTMIATFRRVGQSLFDDKMLTTLKNYLTNSHVLFIGYGGTDTDLIPALIEAKMKSVFWVTRNEEEYNDKSKREPWMTIDRNSGGIRWVKGDLYDSVLAKIETEIFRMHEKESRKQELDRTHNSLPINTGYLQFSESVSALLQILYNIAEVLPASQDIWGMLGAIADDLLAAADISSAGGDRLIRDLHSFRAEAHMQKGEIKDAMYHLAQITPQRAGDLIQARALINAGVILTGRYTFTKANEAEDVFLRALRIAKRLPKREPGRQALAGRCHANLAVLRIYQNRPFEGSQHFKAAERLFREGGSLFEYIGVLMNQARHFMYLGDAASVLKFYFMAEDELMSFPGHTLNEKLKVLQQEISNAGLDVTKIRSRRTAGKLDTDC